jgi:23S rRNA (uracil1939-C5)-methyltransferase
VFVPFTLPGERVRIRLVEEKKRHARAALVEVLAPSPQRSTPRCAHFGACGGCSYQHMSYPDQLAAKAGILREQLERIGGIVGPPVEPMVASLQPFNYRNHVQFHLAADGRLGFFDSQGRSVLAVSECHLPEPPLDELWKQLDFTGYLPTQGETESAPIERIGLRQGEEGDIQLILEGSLAEAPEISVEELAISAAHVSPAGTLVLAGSPAVVFEVLGRPFRVSAGSFFQVNTSMAAAMVEHVLRYLPDLPGMTILDVYCGVGLFSAFLAPQAARLIGIESSPSACEDFVANLDEFDHVELYEATAEEALPALEVEPQFVLVDPPRAGLERGALDALLGLHAPYLCYISCDPATLARDARRLVNGGYVLEKVTPFDLFPQTYHIESISIWKQAA